MEDGIGQYLEKNKKYFHFLHHRINLFLFLKQINFEKKSCTFKLLQNLIRLEKDTNSVLLDVQRILGSFPDTNIHSYYVNLKLYKIVANELNEIKTKNKL